MALSISQTKALAEILMPGMRVCSFGYPDIIAPLEAVKEMMGPIDFCQILYREDSEEICKRHHIAKRKIPDAESVFDTLGCELDVFDIVQERGCEIPLDLNYEIDEALHETYDIVLDVGTLEHCINICQAAFNMAGLVKKDGYIIHENPANWLNHGFYSLNPTWYADFYAANGFKLLDCCLVTRDGRKITVPLTSRFKFTAEEVNVFAIAQRTEVKSFVFPVQSKYAKLIPAAVVSTGDAAAEPRAKEIING